MAPIKHTYSKKDSQTGFALLITLIVVSVIVSIGLSVLDLSIKQVRLSTNAKDSEIAFHAANAGVECGRYWRREASDRMERGQSMPGSFSCFGDPNPPVSGSNNVTDITDDEGVSGDGEAFVYEANFKWGTSPDERCTKITTLVASSTALGSDLDIDNWTLKEYIPGYPGTGGKTCAAGERCTIMSVRGYNRSCSAVEEGVAGILEREVLLQF